MRSQWRTLLAAGIAVASLAAATGAPGASASSPNPATAVEGAEITIALGSEPTSLDPHLVDDGGERAINDNIYETLLARTPDGELVPGLAAELPTQVDDTTWEFNLREGVTFHNGEPFNADSVVATIDRMVGLVERGETDNRRLLRHARRRRSGRRVHRADHDRRPRRRTAGPHVLAQADPGRAPRDPRSLRRARRHRPYRFESRNQGVDIVLVANEEYWGEAGHDRQGDLRVLRRLRHPARRPEVGSLRPDHQPRPQDVEQAPAYASRPGQEHPVLILDPTRASPRTSTCGSPLNIAMDSQAIADSLFGGFATIDAGQLLSPSILGHNAALEPYRVRPRRGRAPARGSRRRRRDDPARRRVRALAQGPRAARGGRRLLELRSGSTCSSRSSSSAPTSTSSSTARTAPTRSTCRAPTTCSTPTASSPRTTRRAASARRTATRRWPALIAAGRSELDPEARQTTYEQAADRLRRVTVRVAGEQRGHLRALRGTALDAAGRRQAARHGDERRRVGRRVDHEAIGCSPATWRRAPIASGNQGRVERRTLSGSLPERPVRPGPRRDRRRQHARVRRHADVRRPGQLHPAAVGVAPSSGPIASELSASTGPICRSSDASPRDASGSTSATRPTSATSRRSTW